MQYIGQQPKRKLYQEYIEQAFFNKKSTVICHFCKRMLWFPYPHTENYKQWQIEGVHRVLRCHTFDDDLEEYVKWKKEYQNSKEHILTQS